MRYNEHVRRSVYGREPAEMENILRDAETRWPEYKTETHLINRPSYQTAVMADDDEHNEAGRWAEAYLRGRRFSLAGSEATPCAFAGRSNWREKTAVGLL